VKNLERQHRVYDKKSDEMATSSVPQGSKHSRSNQELVLQRINPSFILLGDFIATGYSILFNWLIMSSHRDFVEQSPRHHSHFHYLGMDLEPGSQKLGGGRSLKDEENEQIDPVSGSHHPNKKEKNLSIDQSSDEDSKNEPEGTEGEQSGLYHNGRFVTMREVVENYDSFLYPSLTAQQSIDLVAYLKSL
jgi:hypothetical protein